MTTAKKLPSGNWRVNLYIGMENGKKKFKSFTAETKEEAEFLAAAYRIRPSNKNKSKITVGEIVDKYINNKTNVLSATTIREYRRIREKHFQELFNIKICDVDNTVLQTHLNNEYLDISTKTLKNRFNLIIAAIKESYPEINTKVRYPQRVKPEIVLPTTEQINDIINNCDGDLKLAVLLAVYGGLRRGEICALDDIKNNTIELIR